MESQNPKDGIQEGNERELQAREPLPNQEVHEAPLQPPTDPAEHINAPETPYTPQNAGETGDVVADNTQETKADGTAARAEDATDDWLPPQTPANQPPQPTPPQHYADPPLAGEPYSEVDSDILESAGEQGDVVQDYRQETGTDNTAQTTEEAQIESQAAKDEDNRSQQSS